LNAEQIEPLVNEILAASKYRQVAPDLVRSLVGSELGKGRKRADTIKAVKNKLHQIGGAYQVGRPRYADWLAQLQNATAENQLRPACRQIMAQHASTQERLPILDEFYATVLADLPPVNRVLDLACGLNPLAVPWMPLAADAHYIACDIYGDQCEFLAATLPILKVAGEVFVCNLLEAQTLPSADVVLLLKTIPCLEQVDKAIGQRLLRLIDAPVLLISFPVHSLGGHQKGMASYYEQHFYELVDGQPWQIERFLFATELVFRIKK